MRRDVYSHHNLFSSELQEMPCRTARILVGDWQGNCSREQR